MRYREIMYFGSSSTYVCTTEDSVLREQFIADVSLYTQDSVDETGTDTRVTYVTMAIAQRENQ